MIDTILETQQETNPDMATALGLALMQALSGDEPQKQPRRKKVKKQYSQIEWTTQPVNCQEAPHNPFGVNHYAPNPEELFGSQTLAKLEGANTYVDVTDPEQKPELDFTPASSDAYEIYADYEPMSDEEELRDLWIGDLLEEERIAQYHSERMARRRFRVVRTRKIIKDEYGRTIRSNEMNERLTIDNKSRHRSSHKQKQRWVRQNHPAISGIFAPRFKSAEELIHPNNDTLRHGQSQKRISKRIIQELLTADEYDDPLLDYSTGHLENDRDLHRIFAPRSSSELLTNRVTSVESDNMSTQPSMSFSAVRARQRLSHKTKGMSSTFDLGDVGDSSLYTQTLRRYQQNANREG